jgi:serpin B
MNDQAVVEPIRKRRSRLLALLPLFVALGGCAEEDPQAASGEREARVITTLTPVLESVIAANDHLTWGLYRELATPGANLFFSPFSVNAALSMTSLGASGDTEAEMRAVLGIPEPSSDYHQAFGALLADLTGAHRGRGYQLYLANRLFGEETTAFSAPFLAATSSSYRAPLQPVDYRTDPEAARDLVNGWVSDNTQGAIGELVPAGTFDANTRLALANAIYFQSSWATAFDPKNTQNEPFLPESGVSKSIPLMHVKGRFRAAQDELFSMLSLDYADRELSMLVLVPQERGALAKVEGALDEARVNALTLALAEQELAVALPRFEIKSRLDLIPTLKALGMQAAFDASLADFSTMLEPRATQEPLYVSDVLHQGYVKVEEAGTTAAASTAVVVATRSVTPTFRADQPFVFAIRDNLTGALLFVGRVAEPG